MAQEVHTLLWKQVKFELAVGAARLHFLRDLPRVHNAGKEQPARGLQTESNAEEVILKYGRREM